MRCVQRIRLYKWSPVSRNLAGSVTPVFSPIRTGSPSPWAPGVVRSWNATWRMRCFALGCPRQSTQRSQPPMHPAHVQTVVGGATAGYALPPCDAQLSSTIRMSVARWGYRSLLGMSRDTASRKFAPPEQYSGYLLVAPCIRVTPRIAPSQADIRPVVIRTAVFPRSLPVIQTFHIP